MEKNENLIFITRDWDNDTIVRTFEEIKHWYGLKTLRGIKMRIERDERSETCVIYDVVAKKEIERIGQ